MRPLCLYGNARPDSRVKWEYIPISYEKYTFCSEGHD